MTRQKTLNRTRSQTKNFGTRRRKRASSLQFEHLESRLALAVVVSEFLTENDSGITDFSGERHDWIELENTGPATVDVSGWYLSDDASDLTKWQIPATSATQSLGAGERLVIFASDKNGVFADELHTNFKLSPSGESLLLVGPDGTTVEHGYDPYPEQLPDVSYGLGASVDATTTEVLLGSGTTVVGDGSPAQFRPFNSPSVDVDDHWTEVGYEPTANAGWVAATDGLGFGYGAPWQDSTVSLGAAVGGYVRLPFTLHNKAEITGLNLELRVDNAYIAFLNGREVKRERLQTDFKIGNDWEFNARQNLSNSTITGTPSVIDLTPWLGTLNEGENLLAIYAANHNSDKEDFLVHAELTAQRANGSPTVSFLVDPTPGDPNGAGYDGVITDTNFSHSRGFYDAPFPLEISTPEPGTIIRYTTDGSLPTLTNGFTYTEPITVDPSTLSYTDAGVITIRAAAFKPNYVSTNVDTQTYVFLDSVLGQDATGVPPTYAWGKNGPDWSLDQDIISALGASAFKNDLQAIPTMSLVTDWEEFWGISEGTSDERGIYPQSEGWRDKSDEIGSSLEFFTSDGSEEFQVDAAVEIQGHSSTLRWRTDKLSLQVKFKQPYDTTLDADTLFVNSAVAGDHAATQFDTFILDAQYNYTWLHDNPQQYAVAKYINDQVVADYVNLAGGASPHGRWVHLYINGMYWGIYNAHERPDDSFADEYYGGREDDYFAVKAFDGVPSHPEEYLQVDGGLTAEAAYAALLNQTHDDLALPDQYAEVESLLDIDSFIDYMIVHFYAGNWDWGQDNWYATWNHVEPGSKWHFHSWDQEHAFPTADNQPYGETNFDVTYNSTGKNDAYGPTGIHQALMASDEYRLRFSDRVQKLLANDGLLTPDRAAAVWQARIDELANAINGEAARWGDSKGNEDGADWLANVTGVLSDFYPYRTAIVRLQFDSGGNDWLVEDASPEFSQYGGTIAAGFQLSLTNPNNTGTLFYTVDGSDPRDRSTNGPSATAVAYSGPIPLSESTRVRARVFADSPGSANDWSAEVDKTFLAEQPLQLRIVELNYHPEAAEEHEFIELLNTGTTTISLDGVSIADFAGTPYTFDEGLTLAAGERIVVARNPLEFQARYGTQINLAPSGYANANLSNGGESISLRGPLNELLQSFTYDDATPWPTSPDGNGYSLEYVGPLAAGEDPHDGAPADPFDDPTNWRASLTAGGSPGSGGSTGMVDTADFDSDGDVDGRDFLRWQRGFGAPSATNSDGDADHDADVDDADLAIWQQQFGAPMAVNNFAFAVEAGPIEQQAYWLPVLAVEQPSVAKVEEDITAASFTFDEHLVDHVFDRYTPPHRTRFKASLTMAEQSQPESAAAGEDFSAEL